MSTDDQKSSDTTPQADAEAEAEPEKLEKSANESPAVSEVTAPCEDAASETVTGEENKAVNGDASRQLDENSPSAETGCSAVECSDTESTSSEERDIGRRRHRSDEEEDGDDQEECADKKEVAKPAKGESDYNESGDETFDDRSDDEDYESDADEEHADKEESAEPTGEPEDRQNPAFVPKHGNFYQHDLRLGDEPKPEPPKPEKQTKKQMMMEKQDKWTHDMFYENEQVPKTRQELISAYGYDIRDENKAPRTQHGRRYGRSQKVERDWRDADAYNKRGRRGRGGRGRGFGSGPSRNFPSSQQDDVQRSSSFDRQQNDDGQCVMDQAGRSRSLSQGERDRTPVVDEQKVVNSRQNPIRGGGGRYNSRGANNRASFPTVEFRRRGRGTAFTAPTDRRRNARYSDQIPRHRMDDGQSPRENTSRGLTGRDDRRSNGTGFYASNDKESTYNTRQKFYQDRPPMQSQASNDARISMSDSNPGNDDSLEEVVTRQQNMRPRQQHQDGSRGGATKRYSTIRQQVHQQMGPLSTSQIPQQQQQQQQQPPPPPPMMVPVTQQHLPQVMVQRQPRAPAPMTVIAPHQTVPQMQQPFAPPIPYQQYFDGMYGHGVVPIPDTYGAVTLTDGTYHVTPTAAYMDHQQYPPPPFHRINPPQYAGDGSDMYVTPPSSATANSTGGTIYYNPDSQQQGGHRYTRSNVKSKPKSSAIQIIAPEQVAGAKLTSYENKKVANEAK